jgi:hypothetical protein
MIKQLLIYRKSDKIGADGKYPNILLRTVGIHPTFVGIGKTSINPGEFKKLAEDLEPTSTSFDVIDL